MTYYRKMTVVPTRAGLMYECRWCTKPLTPEEADLHTEEECDEYHHANA